jgi:hypothetical protein
MFQDFFTICLKELCCSQKFSNLNILALGILVRIEITHGKWLEVRLINEKTSVGGMEKLSKSLMETNLVFQTVDIAAYNSK